MQGMRQKNKISILMAGLLLLCTAATVQAEESIYVPLTGNVILRGEKSTEQIHQDEFSFRLSGEDIEDEIIGVDTGGTVDFGGITIYGEGEFHFFIEQVMENIAGYTYDISPIQVNIHSYRDQQGTLTYEMEYRKNDVKTDRMQFVNEYHTPVEKKLDVRTESTSDTVTPLSEITHTIHVKNTGRTTLDGIYVREYIPTYSLYLSHTGEAGKYGVIQGREHVTWFFGQLAAGEEKTLSLSFRVNECIPTEAAKDSRILFEVTGNRRQIPTNDPQDPGYSSSY